MSEVVPAAISQTPRKKGPRGGVKFSSRLAELLGEHGKQARVARAAGVYPSTTRRLAQGTLGCNPEIAQRIADELGEPLERLCIRS